MVGFIFPNARIVLRLSSSNKGVSPMSDDYSKTEVSEALRRFTSKRDDLLHEEEATFFLNLERFIEFCESDKLISDSLSEKTEFSQEDVENWWQLIKEDQEIQFPSHVDEEIKLRWGILKSLEADTNLIYTFGRAVGNSKRDEAINLFRSIVVRPLADELTHLVGEAANIATPEERALQAVPLSRILSSTEVRIFLSHKSIDKPFVLNYYNALKEVGFDPWLDEEDMPAGSNLERSILDGFESSCAAIFFITENFTDEKYLAAEVDYAVMQKNKKGEKFSIITLRFPGSSPVPKLLTRFVYKGVRNDLEGFYEILRALPIELGPTRWKAGIVD